MPSGTLYRSKSQFFLDAPKEVRTPYLISLLCVSMTAMISLFMYTALPPEIPLFYSLASPEQHIVTKEWIFLLPALSTLFFIVNILAARYTSAIDLTLRQMLTWLTIIFLGMSCFALLRLSIILS